MLLRFEVSNHRSVMKPVELSMIAVDEDRTAARSFDRLTEKVLSVAGIYGPNASGKSNVLDALQWLSTAVRQSLLAWDQVIPLDRFRFGSGQGNPSVFEVEAMVAGVRYTYRLELDSGKVLFEGLYSYPERRQRVLFERDGLEVSFRRGTGSVAGVRELLTPTTLVLSAAVRVRVPELEVFGRYLGSFRVLGAASRADALRAPLALTQRIFDSGPPGQATLFEDDELPPIYQRQTALELLRFAELGIRDVQIVEDEGDPRLGGSFRRSLRLVHGVGGQELLFDLKDESSGTLTWLRLIGPVIVALRAGQVLLFDEIDASLHPKLSARLLELFQDPETNPHGAQLIFTTHDTSLLNHLNRDEVWLTEKGDDGATTLTALAEYGGDKVRRSLNLEKAYLQGRFGAVPDLDQYKLRSALGLAAEDA